MLREVCILAYHRIFKLICLLLFLICCNVVFGDQNKSPQKVSSQLKDRNIAILFDEPERKDPFIAAVLSWSWSGLGQFYTQNYKKGSAFLLADLAEKGALIYMLFYISDKYSQRDEGVQWSSIDKKDQCIVIGLIGSIFFTRVLSVIDAVDSANNYNKTIYYPYWQSKQYFKSSDNYQKDMLQFSITKKISLQ